MHSTPPRVPEKAVDAPIAPALTRREHEVLALAAQALSNRVIARHLDISEKTVKKHLTAVYAKLGVTCRMEAVLRTLGQARSEP